MDDGRLNQILAAERSISECDSIRTFAGYYDHESIAISAMKRAVKEAKPLPAAPLEVTDGKDLKALLADCYMALHDHYHEAQPDYQSPPEPADEWSYNIIPLFVAIQRATGMDHGQLMLERRANADS